MLHIPTLLAITKYHEYYTCFIARLRILSLDVTCSIVVGLDLID
jgi:hypothetical protein